LPAQSARREERRHIKSIAAKWLFVNVFVSWTYLGVSQGFDEVQELVGTTENALTPSKAPPCHSRESGNPATSEQADRPYWIPAFAEMTNEDLSALKIRLSAQDALRGKRNGA
jgi:hypothetical protein